VTQALALSFASIALFIACGGSASPPAAAPAKAPYGYEFTTDTTEAVAASPAGTTYSPPTGPSGRLFSESIQTVVRGHFGQVLTCYEAGRRSDPQLKGKVTVKFVIGEDGITKEAADAGSTLPDKEVINCVVDAFRQRKYRESHGGDVTVVYPIQFAP
jgi:hypothetical protein